MKMRCPHCSAGLSAYRPFNRPVESGLAYAQACTACNRVVAIRPRVHSDPPVLPGSFTRQEIARLLFVRWRLVAECQAQTCQPVAQNRAAPRAAA
jgi:hypothetical protein